MGWKSNVQDIMYSALCAAFDMDPDAQASMDKFMPYYIDGMTIPQNDSDADVCFYDVSIAPGEEFVLVNGSVNARTIRERIPVSVLFSFYGPSAEEEAEAFYRRVIVDTGHGCPRYVMRAGDCYPAFGPGLMPARPVLLWEPEGTFWRRRCDLRLNFVYLYEDKRNVNTVTEAPEIVTKVAE